MTVQVVLLFGLSISCAKVEFRAIQLEPIRYIDDDFFTMVEGFKLNYQGIWPTNLTIIFGEKDHAGTCNEEIQVILINKTTWPKISNYQQEALVFHEMAHCLMKLGHIQDGSITYMTLLLSSTEYYKDNREELFQNLFGIQDVILYELPKEPETKITANK